MRSRKCLAKMCVRILTKSCKFVLPSQILKKLVPRTTIDSKRYTQKKISQVMVLYGAPVLSERTLVSISDPLLLQEVLSHPRAAQLVVSSPTRRISMESTESQVMQSLLAARLSNRRSQCGSQLSRLPLLPSYSQPLVLPTQRPIPRTTSLPESTPFLPQVRAVSTTSSPAVSPTSFPQTVPSTSSGLPSATKSSKNRYYIDEIQEWDVISGRGGLSNHHTGNRRYRQIVSDVKAMYQTTEAKTGKTDLSRAVVDHVCSYGGRFIKKDSVTGKFYVLTRTEARRKASQALRETKQLKWTA